MDTAALAQAVNTENPASSDESSITSQPENSVESGTTEVTNNDESTDTETVDNVENTDDITGSEPAALDKRTKELIRQRKRAQEAEQARVKAEQELAYYRGLAEGRNPNKPEDTSEPANIEPTRPDLADFEGVDGQIDFAAYEQAHEAYLLEMAEHRAAQRIMADHQAREEQARIVKIQQNFEDKIQKAAEKDPEILEIAEKCEFLDHNNPLTRTLALELLQGEPAMLRHLYDHPDVVAQLYRSPSEGALLKALGKLEAKLESIKPAVTKTVSAAPAPIKTVEPVGAIDVPLEEISDMKDYIARRKASGRYR